MSRLRRAWEALWRHGSPVEAASHGRRWDGFRPVVQPKEAIIASRHLVMARARALVMNNALAASGAEAWTSGLIGSGIIGKSAHPNEGARRRLDRTWGRWTGECDADGRLEFFGLQSLIARRVVVDGESLVHTKIVNGKLRLRVMESGQLAPVTEQTMPTGNRIVSGVEFDREGRRVAYQIYPNPPGQIPDMVPVRVPAADILHIFRLDHPGQIRGLSWFAPVLLALTEHGKLSDALVMQQQVAAMLTGFIRTLDGDASAVFPGDKREDRTLPSLEPGSMVSLDPQQDVTFSTPPRSLSGELVKKSAAREIAAGLGLPYEALTGDLESVNFSSIRASLVEWRRKCEALQNSIFIAQCLDPIWSRFVAIEALAGRLYAPGDLAPYTEAKWFLPKWAWVDPEKDAGANILALQNGLASRSQILSELGRDAEEVDAEIAADRAREQALGLTFQPTPVSASVPVRP